MIPLQDLIDSFLVWILHRLNGQRVKEKEILKNAYEKNCQVIIYVIFDDEQERKKNKIAYRLQCMLSHLQEVLIQLDKHTIFSDCALIFAALEDINANNGH